MRLLLKLLLIPGAVAALSFIQGFSGYMNGTATLMSVGLPGLEYGNLDPSLRVYRRTSGCMVTGFEFLTHVPNNIAIALAGKIFGPMRGTYHGPYPSREEAMEALRVSSTTVMAAAEQGLFQPVRDCGALVELHPPIDGVPVARCAMFKDSTIILGRDHVATLFDRGTGARYARYRVRD